MPGILLNGHTVLSGYGINEILQCVYHKYVLKSGVCRNVVLRRLYARERIGCRIIRSSVNSSKHKRQLTAINVGNIRKIAPHIRNKRCEKLLVEGCGGILKRIRLALHIPDTLKVWSVSRGFKLCKSLRHSRYKAEIKIARFVSNNVQAVLLYVSGRRPRSVFNCLIARCIVTQRGIAVRKLNNGILVSAILQCRSYTDLGTRKSAVASLPEFYRGEVGTAVPEIPYVRGSVC